MRRRPFLLAIAAGIVLTAPAARAQSGRAVDCPGDLPAAAVRQEVRYGSGDHAIGALLYTPRVPNGAGVVLLHGASGFDANAFIFDHPALQLASRGYHVLVPSYYDAFAAGPRRSDDAMRAWRRAASDGADFLGRQPGADASRIALFGYSLGGFLAVEAALEARPAAAAVSAAGGLDVGTPGRGRRDIPLLLLYARRDQVISPVSTRRWAERLRGRGLSVDLQSLDETSHLYTIGTWCDVFDRTRVFLDRTLSPPAP